MRLQRRKIFMDSDAIKASLANTGVVPYKPEMIREHAHALKNCGEMANVAIAHANKLQELANANINIVQSRENTRKRKRSVSTCPTANLNDHKKRRIFSSDDLRERQKLI